MTYFSTFIPGLGEIVRDHLVKKLEGFKLELLLDGLVVYSSTSNIEKIKLLKFLNNSFLLVNPEEKLKISLGKSFRVVFSRENELVAVNKERLARIESKIAKLNNLIIDRADPDFEFWFLERREGQRFTGVRITKHPDYKTVLAKGQLRPELAHLLCLISEPNKEDIVLDPFAGSGAIGTARENYPYKKIISGDIKPVNQNIRKLDALDLKYFKNNSVSKIITDPPWGISVGTDLDLNNFYSKMLQEFSRVLRPDGLLIILIGQKELFEEVLKRLRSFTLVKRYNILVSGKKAAIYKITKK
jgi:23S rRNA G2445 N2-methylase RlmL